MARIKEHIEDLVEKLEQKEELEAEKHKKVDGIILLLRNGIVLAAAVLFVISLILKGHSSILRSIAYFCGTGAYFLEMLLLTDCFSKRIPHREMFMAYCFGPLYILLGISYLIGH